MLFQLYLFFSTLFALAYVIVMIVNIKAWRQAPHWSLPEDFIPATKISVLIAARNEADGIAACLESIKKQSYPAALFEVIVINDFSEDATAEIVATFGGNIRLIHLADYAVEKGSKKKAIEIGVGEATGTLIVTTDADCLVQENWLAHIAAYYQATGKKFIAAPVNFFKEKNTFERAQSLDFAGLMAITSAGIHLKIVHMCNGANLAYERSVFYEVGGFKGIDQLASGDDMLLMQKVALVHPDGIGFIKNIAATNYTYAKPTIGSFISQRVRWASKTNSYKEVQITLILAMVFFFCCNIPFSLLVSPLLGWSFFYVFLAQILIKFIFDCLLLYPTVVFFKRKDLLRVLIPAFFGHIVYILLVGFLANLVYNYEWKGRKVR